LLNFIPGLRDVIILFLEVWQENSGNGLGKINICLVNQGANQWPIARFACAFA
jgi:hypothetical protein